MKSNNRDTDVLSNMVRLKKRLLVGLSFTLCICGVILYIKKIKMISEISLLQLDDVQQIKRAMLESAIELWGLTITAEELEKKLAVEGKFYDPISAQIVHFDSNGFLWNERLQRKNWIGHV